MRRSKSYKLEAILEERITRGDYMLVDFPAERKLAAAFNVTQMTARKAVKNLERRGLLLRQKNGSVTATGKQNPTAVFLAPAVFSSHIFRFQHLLHRSASESGWQLRTVLYMHWDDVVIEEALERFDGVFLYPVRETVSERLTELLQKTKTPVIALGIDLSKWGVPFFVDQPNNAAALMVDYLYEQGYQEIDFLLTQPGEECNQTLIEQWRNRLKYHGLTGKCFNFSVESYGDSYEQAFRCVSSLLKQNKFQSRCLLGASMAEAVGACRALASHGIQPGREIAVSCVHKTRGGIGDYYIPSITGVEAPDCKEILRKYFNWMANPEACPPEEMAYTGEPGRVFPGESVVPAVLLQRTKGKKR